MGCHAQVWNDSPMLEPVRRSYFSGQPIAWNRVHSVPDFVYFNHSIHVTRARVTCAECHGDIESEALVHRERLFTMGWCLDCHRRRAEDRRPGPTLAALGGEVLPPPAHGQTPRLRGQAQLTTCTTCHR
jgi:hypothetical protein